MITTDGYLYFIDRALDGMAEVLTGLGDDRANRRPGPPGGNSPYALVTHCLGVVSFWGGQVVSGRDVARDREAEFTATGSVDELVARLHAVREQFAADVAAAVPADPCRGVVPPKYRDTPIGRSQGMALQHVYEELAQHRGHLEATRDLLTAGEDRV
ncbi:DinB family protein [Amycolatopsis sp. PS_44_ISF1]|uniref:DinB family protein n=1 Tax=Amycolatopsis sp. PS_44_ISF1 TaxID=2974917 RepID=UPI0028E03B0D|nr:DinB family protein [Amycolatopsis sp. PS_44_ISF1]MDT8913445.1 DinB family protein [Amycolatopsis sp. PS_44_ISF1]